MRLCTPAHLCLAAAAAAAVLLPGAHPARADAPAPACAAPDDHTFPLTTRIHGGPDSYTTGGGFGTWYVDLTNTTDRTCTGIHPVVVLVDDKRALEPSQPRLEFFEGPRAHPVRFEKTGEDELVGAFADEEDRFAGFTVGPGRTVTVKVRLMLTSDAVPNDVTANAAVVQRHDDDGDWVGQSNDYRFGIDGGDAGTGTGTDTDTHTDPGTGKETRPGTDPDASVPPREDRLPFAEELARTGTGTQVAAAAALLLTGGGVLLVARRRR
ncbi:LPXTG cell wall anchor domain-containing protein [Streptomyces collinus]|uniref:LPXTG-motif cell wall-anchored protein n=1 Tax=Streptomyces collinus TaxID=42684 RepID=A0AA89Q2F8_STRCU|nr:LPXTG cell wall anchor domain-containing protein [Streptomyces collinus]MBB5811343.1 LPXTG-motif cell wall-anchored protein [Streptomyces collinus]WMX64580.1 LPXTG cell wall anchor domain-containing protein [Streptomyces collinus]